MLNFTYYPAKHARAQQNFQALMAGDTSALDGVSFNVSPTALLAGDTSALDFVLNEAPDRLKLIISLAMQDMPDPAPFQTLDVAGRAVPVLTDPDFVAWLLSAAAALHDYLDEAGQLGRLYSVHFSPFGNTPDDGQFHIPGDATAWAKIGVTHETAAAALVSYGTQLVSLFPGVSLHMSILNPYEDFIGPLGNGDGGKVYLALEAALQTIPGYVTFDQTLVAPAERAIIRQAAGTGPYAAMISTLPAATQAAGITAAGKLALGYGALWLECQGDQVPLIGSWMG
jgi:hypothetical protein